MLSLLLPITITPIVTAAKDRIMLFSMKRRLGTHGFALVLCVVYSLTIKFEGNLSHKTLLENQCSFNGFSDMD